MALTITGLSGFSSQSSGQSKPVSFDSRLSVHQTGSSDRSSATSSVSSEELAQRRATLKLSGAASSVNTKQYYTEEQLNTVNSLLAKANEIKRETNGTRAASIAQDATNLITATETNYSTALSQTPTLNQTETVYTKVSAEASAGSSAGDFSTTISSVQSLASVGITSALSFDKSTIDNTIDALEAAQQGLSSSFGSFNSVRADISAEVQARGTDAQLVQAKNSQPSIEEIARRAAAQIGQSTESLLAHHQIEQLDVASLLDSSSLEKAAA